MWGAAWLFRATNAVFYYNLVKSLGADDQPDIFSWDNKYAGAHVLLSRVYLSYCSCARIEKYEESTCLYDVNLTRWVYFFIVTAESIAEW